MLMCYLTSAYIKQEPEVRHCCLTAWQGLPGKSLVGSQSSLVHQAIPRAVVSHSQLSHPTVNTVTSFPEYQRLGLSVLRNTKQVQESSVRWVRGPHLSPTSHLISSVWATGQHPVCKPFTETDQIPCSRPPQEGPSSNRSLVISILVV